MPPVALAIAPIAGFIGLTSTQLIIGVLATAAQVGLSFLQQEKARSQDSNSGPQSFTQNFSQGTVPRYVVLGKAPVGGVRAFFEATGGSLYMATILSDDLIEGVSAYYLRGIECLVDANGYVTTPPFNTATEKLVNFELHFGYVDQPPSALLLAAFPGVWTSDHKLQGIAYLVTKIKQPPTAADWQTIFNGRIPEIGALVKGSLVHDPRDVTQNLALQATWKNTNNPALNLLYYFTSVKGFALPRSMFALDTFINVANYCDQSITQVAGGIRKRYEMGGVFSYDEDPTDIAQNILDTFAGELYITGNGLVGLACDGTDVATVSITEDMVIDIEIDHAPGALYEYSSVKGRFSSENHGYALNVEEADPWVDEVILARITRDIPFSFDMPYVFNHSQARRLMKKKMLRLNPAWSLNLVLDYNGIELLGERLFTFSYPLIGTLTFKIESVFPDDQDGFAKMHVRCSSVDPESFLWNPAIEEGVSPAIAPTTTGSAAPQAPISLSVLVGDTDPTATFVGRALCSWTADTVGHFQEAQWRDTATSTYTTLSPTPTDRALTLTGLISGTTYEFRVRVSDAKYGVSNWTSITFVATAASGTTTALQTLTASGGVNVINASSLQSTAATAAYVEFTAVPASTLISWTGSVTKPAVSSQLADAVLSISAGSHDVYARSIGINGDLGAVSGPVTVTIAAVINTSGSSGSGNGSSLPGQGTQGTNNNSGLYGNSDPTVIGGGLYGGSDPTTGGGNGLY